MYQTCSMSLKANFAQCRIESSRSSNGFMFDLIRRQKWQVVKIDYKNRISLCMSWFIRCVYSVLVPIESLVLARKPPITKVIVLFKQKNCQQTAFDADIYLYLNVTHSDIVSYPQEEKENRLHPLRYLFRQVAWIESENKSCYDRPSMT